MSALPKLLHKAGPWGAAAVGFVALLFSVTTQSIDMDEAQTWDYVHLETPGSVWQELRSDPNSESQMPLGMLISWGWGRLTGTGEYPMRSLNFFWAAVMMACMGAVGSRLRLPWLPLLFAVQPFLWFTMDFARTSAMQMAGGSLLLVGAITCLDKNQLKIRTVALLGLGALILCGGSMLGLVPLIAVSGGLLIHAARGKLRLSRGAMITALVALVLLAGLGAYYVTTLLRGAGGTKIWAVSPANALFVLYEFLGFQGLGPGRQALRAIMKGQETDQSLVWSIPGYFALAGSYAVVILAALKSWATREVRLVSTRLQKSEPHLEACNRKRPNLFPVWLMAAGATGLSLLLLYALAAIVGFPFWGRHLAGAFPFGVLVLAVTINWAGQGLMRRAGRLASAGVVILLLISTVLIRFSPAHRHDDYCGASLEANAVSSGGGRVWWVADHSGGAYYGLPLVESATGIPGEIQFAANQAKEPDTLPDAIIISRPENFDVHGTAKRLLRSDDYVLSGRLQAFEIWKLR